MPNTLSWGSRYSVGDATLDRQHKKLLNLCNQLAICASDSSPHSDALFREILDELSAYAREHFATEEAILKACAYPRLATQQWDHSEYEQQVAHARVSAGEGVLDKAGLQRLLSTWWNDHILISDMDYRQHVLAYNQHHVQAGKRPELIYSNGKAASELRESAQLKQHEFWAKVGVSRSRGSRYECGQEIPELLQILLQLTYGSEAQAAELLAWLRWR